MFSPTWQVMTEFVGMAFEADSAKTWFSVHGVQISDIEGLG